MNTLRLGDPRVRTNPAYQLVPWALLHTDDQRVLTRATGGASPFVLLPRETHTLHAKAVDAPGARLLGRLMEPAPASRCFADDPSSRRKLVQLVLDAVLEIELHGAFLSGPSAIDLLGVPDLPPSPPDDRLGEISRAALRYASALPIADARRLSYRLYQYNTVPLGARWTRSHPDKTSVTDALGLGPNGAQRERLAPAFDEIDSPHWSVWRHGDADPAARLLHKLYVSPLPDDLPGAFPRIVTALIEHGVPSFKIGRDLPGILRPDKLVAYFPDHASLHRAAAALRPALAGCRAQGVPFSAALDPLGLLSWGGDPPPEEQLPGWTHGESWRLWITNRLALGLRHAQLSAPAIEPCRYALRRLSVEGVDTASWAPTGALWN